MSTVAGKATSSGGEGSARGGKSRAHAPKENDFSWATPFSEASEVALNGSGKKQYANNGNLHSTIDSVVFGADTDGSDVARDPRDFLGAAGTPSIAAAHGGIFGEGHAPHLQAAYGARSSADSVIFNHDIDRSSELRDPREVASLFHGAAGHRSGHSAALPPMTLGEPRADRVGFEDIPHAHFTAGAGVRRVDGGTASRAEAGGILFGREHFSQAVRPPRAGGGAAGETSDQSAARRERDAQAGRSRVKGASDGAAAAELVFGHQMDPLGQAARDAEAAHLARLYGVGAGSRSESYPSHVAASDVAQRATASGRLSDDAVLKGDGRSDPRGAAVFEASAGRRSSHLADKSLGPIVDISYADRLGAPHDVAGRVGAPTDFAAHHPRGVRGAREILEGDDVNSGYATGEYAGVGSRYLAPGEPGQRKWVPGKDFVMTRPISDISDFVYASEAAQPSAG